MAGESIYFDLATLYEQADIPLRTCARLRGHAPARRRRSRGTPERMPLGATPQRRSKRSFVAPQARPGITVFAVAGGGAAPPGTFAGENSGRGLGDHHVGRGSTDQRPVIGVEDRAFDTAEATPAVDEAPLCLEWS